MVSFSFARYLLLFVHSCHLSTLNKSFGVLEYATRFYYDDEFFLVALSFNCINMIISNNTNLFQLLFNFLRFLVS